MLTDAELLQRYVAEHAEDAFAELVRRHLDLVYAAALRRTNGRHALAEDIAQKVFTDLARKAATLTSHPTLTGWLYRSTRYVAIDAIRVEQRREKLAHSLTAMPDETSLAESSADWEQLRPVLDEAMDQLKEQDREIMLLRFFRGLTFAEVGAHLNLSENTARMRAERALDKLRFYLGKRGITSTAALAGLLTSQSLVAAPASLVATVTSTALSAAPAGGASLLTTILMSKISLPILSIALAAGLTVLTWNAVASDVSSGELAALRTENVSLKQATTGGAPTAAVTAVADAYSAQAKTIVEAAGKRLGERSGVGTSQYRNCGQATPQDATRTLAWAYDSSDVTTLTKLFIYDEEGLKTIRAIYATMPESIRQQYRTPEELIAFLYAAQIVFNPLPGEDVWERKVTNAVVIQPSAGRALLRDPGQKRGGLMYVQTAEGWKLELDSGLLKSFVARVLSNEMLAKLGAH